MRRESGFTLIELMVTIAVAAIILGLGVPSFTELVERNRRTAVVNDLVTDIHVSRAEAMARNVDVVLCRGNGNPAAPACTTGSEWSSGWLSFADLNDNGTLDAATEPVLAARDSLPVGINLYGSNASVTFSRFSGSQASFSICINNDRLRGIILDRGRPRLGETLSDGVTSLTCS